MPQFQAQVPHPLRDHLPALLPPGGVAAPAIRVLFGILIGERRLKGATMQIEFDDIGSGECLLWQVAEKEFVDHAPTGEANRTLLLAGRMGRYHHATQQALRPHRHVWAVVEAAHGLAFWALLDLIRGEVQTCLDQRVIEHAVLFATGHVGEAGQISQHGSRAILSVESEQGALCRKLVCRQIPLDG